MTLSASKPQQQSSKHDAAPWAVLYRHTLLSLFAFRLLNALVLRTFFQPDEYYQSLEPAWWVAFGHDSGAWTTWEWKQHLRAALHPGLFALVYKSSNVLVTTLDLSASSRAAVLLATPKTLQAFIAALGDYYTYKLAQQVYGRHSRSAVCTILLTVGSAWNWFVSTRTFSNCIETTLTAVALYNWPYHWALGSDEVGFQLDSNILRIRRTDSVTLEEEEAIAEVDETTRLRRTLFCASTAVILRPTNAIIWLTLTTATFGRGMYRHGVHWEVDAFIRQGLFCSGIVLALSAFVDRLFYDVWTFPVWQFFKFNVLQSLAVFYGNNNWHYYLSQGYPLLLTAAVVPAALGLRNALILRDEPRCVSIQSRLILHRLALVSIVLPLVLSVLSHKEVRFIYPILPALHVIAALPFAKLVGFTDIIASGNANRRQRTFKPTLFGAFFITINVMLASYFSLFHNSGLIKVTDYLRSEFEAIRLPQAEIQTQLNRNLTFAILMPCHSIPWRSHIQYPPTFTTPGISGWALTCEPPLNLSPSEKATYQDEADIFYLDPAVWLKKNMVRDPPSGPPSPGVHAPDPADARKLWSNPNPQRGVWLNEGEGGQNTGVPNRRKRAWPDYLIFFKQLEPSMKATLGRSAYRECARFHNSLFHDDWRRTGDVIVWCLPDVHR
ncbi:glycosylphosphatidylinositol anchor biosynthesis [Lithohypha guttulata]|nr:glycosylphosphatidylinositol anchor biosynthesis [Lithohypha guttulata]